MRSAIVSVALLAFAHSLAPGVHGAPAVVSDHTNSLAVRQNPVSILDTMLDLVRGILSTAPIPSQLAEQLAQQVAQELQGSAPSGVLRRAPSSSNSTLSTSFTPVLPTTTSRVLAVATDRIGASTVGSTSSVSLSTPQASSTPQTRMRRQLPSGLPTAALSGVLSIVGSQSVPLPVPSVAASAVSAVLGKPGSATSQSAASKSTPSNPVQA